MMGLNTRVVNNKPSKLSTFKLNNVFLILFSKISLALIKTIFFGKVILLLS